MLDPQFFNELGQTQILTLMAVTVFFGVFLFAMAVIRTMRARADVRHRVFREFAGAGAPTDGDDAWTDRRSLRHKALVDSSRVILSAASKFAPSDKESRASLRMDMVKAGFFDPAAMYWYYAARIILALSLPFALLATVQVSNVQLPGYGLLVLAAAAGVFGLILPSFYIDRRQKRVQQQARDGFPDFMDLMVVCVEAGISPPAGMDRVGRELAMSWPHLSANLHLASLELRAGQSLTNALDNLAQRLGIEEVLSLAALLRQSEELGTSVGEALRVYSLEMRDKRLSRAEEKAHALPVKLVLPLGLFIFPVMLTVIMLPLIIRMKGVFF